MRTIADFFLAEFCDHVVCSKTIHKNHLDVCVALNAVPRQAHTDGVVDGEVTHALVATSVGSHALELRWNFHDIFSARVFEKTFPKGCVTVLACGRVI